MARRRFPLPLYETPDPPRRLVAGTYGDMVIEWARRQLRLELGDTWQGYVLRKMLRHDSRGDIIAKRALISVARQNGKTTVARALTGWLLDEGQFLEPFREWSAVLAAADTSKQARLLYSAVRRDMEDRADPQTEMRLSDYRGISAGHLDFDVLTNQPGASRGWSAGFISFDEVLTQTSFDMLEAIGPTQSAQRSPLMLLTSTAGHADSVVLRSFWDRTVRQAAGAEKPDPSFYGAIWTADNPDAGLDWQQILMANPALGDRLTKQAIESEYAILPADSYRRERLNTWVERRADGAVNVEAWAKCRTAEPLKDCTGPFSLGIDVVPGGARATIAVAGVRPDGRIGVEVYRDLRPTVDGTVTSDRIISAIHEFSEPLATIAYDRVSGMASAFERDADETGLPYDGLTAGAMVDASMDVSEMITSGRLAVDDPLLDAQAPLVARRNVGNEGAFRYSRKASGEPVDAFMAAVLAAHAAAYALRKPFIL